MIFFLSFLLLPSSNLDLLLQFIDSTIETVYLGVFCIDSQLLSLKLSQGFPIRFILIRYLLVLFLDDLQFLYLFLELRFQLFLFRSRFSLRYLSLSILKFLYFLDHEVVLPPNLVVLCFNLIVFLYFKQNVA